MAKQADQVNSDEGQYYCDSDDVEVRKSSTSTTKKAKSNSSSCSSSGVESMAASGPQLPSGCPGAVGQWLKFLQMDRYLQDFVDNGYDDFETVKQIGPEDLHAIGVSDGHHQSFILDAVRVLREQGAVWVYLLDEEDVCQSPYRSRAAHVVSSPTGTSRAVAEVTPEFGRVGRLRPKIDLHQTSKQFVEDQDLIQRVREPESKPQQPTSTSSSGSSSSNSFYSSTRVKASRKGPHFGDRDPDPGCSKPLLAKHNLSNMSPVKNKLMAVLVEKLSQDGVDLSVPPFSSKVRINSQLNKTKAFILHILRLA